MATNSKGLTLRSLFFKTIFDLIVSLLGLLILFPIITIAWIVSAIDTKSNGFFTQNRIGKNGKIFRIIKIKTMKKIDGVNTNITTSDDVRLTQSGIFIRKNKIDELPQLLNVLIGQMSIVGPRPDVPGYANQLKDNDRIILTVRPGITGPAQIAYRHEEDMLSSQTNPMEFNNQVIWPDKVRINREYVENYSFLKDIFYIWATIKR